MNIDKFIDFIFPVTLLLTISVAVFFSLGPMEIAMMLVVTLSLLSLIALLTAIVLTTDSTSKASGSKKASKKRNDSRE